MIKAVFFDIDGTLLNEKGQVLPSTKLAIKEMQSKGIICGIATGRAPVKLAELIEHVEFDVFVTYNGQYVYAGKTDIYEKVLPKTAVKKIAKFGDENGGQLMFGGKDKLAGSPLMIVGQKKWLRQVSNFLPKKLIKKYGSKVVERVSKNKKNTFQVSTILDEPIFQCVMVGEPALLEKVRTEIPEVATTTSSVHCIDIIPMGGSKIVGIKKAIRYFGIEMEEVMAFGDSWNDLEMLKEVGIGIAMGNGIEELKQVADDVTASNNEDGIYKALIKKDVIKGEKNGR